MAAVGWQGDVEEVGCLGVVEVEGGLGAMVIVVVVVGCGGVGVALSGLVVVVVATDVVVLVVAESCHGESARLENPDSGLAFS